MKKLFIALMVWVLSAGVAMADFIDHPNYAKVTTLTESVVASIADAQSDFFVIHGRYFQGLWLLGDVQVDGTTDETVINTSQPSDFDFSWRDFESTIFKNNLKIPINIRIDVYEHPTMGWGWIFRAEVFYEGLDPDAYGTYGDHWVYQHNSGTSVDASKIWDEWYIEKDILD